jgi:hypothetical protein
MSNFGALVAAVLVVLHALHRVVPQAQWTWGRRYIEGHCIFYAILCRRPAGARHQCSSVLLTVLIDAGSYLAVPLQCLSTSTPPTQ